MIKILVGLYVAVCFTNTWSVSSQRTIAGTCAQFGKTQVPIFSMISYMGLWYVQGTYPRSFESIPDHSDCLSFRYMKTYWGNANITELSKILATNTPHRDDTLMKFDRPKRGHYTYADPTGGLFDWPIDIISTDYISYTIEWSCIPNGDSVDTYIWVMSRSRYVDNLYNARISKILRAHNIDESFIKKENQDEALCGQY